MKRMFLSLAATLAACLTLAAAPQVKAADMEPVIVVSFAGYDELKADIDFIGELANQPGASAMLEGLLMAFTQQKGFDGLDKTRPWGAALSTDGLEFQMLAFLPVDKPENLTAALAPLLGEPEELDDDVSRIMAGNTPVFIKPQGEWLFIAQLADGLKNLPADPMTFLSGLDDDYDIAIRVDVQNVPEQYRSMAVDNLQMGVESNLDQGDDETDDAFEMRKNLARTQVDQITALLEELDQLTLGWKIDAEAKSTYLDTMLTFVPDSDLAKQSMNLETVASTLSGFLAENVPFALLSSTKVKDESLLAASIEQTESAIAKLREQVMAEIDKEERLASEPEKKAEIKEIIDELFEVLAATAKEGRMDVGMTVNGDGPLSLSAAVRVADGRKVEEAIKKFVALGKDEEDFPEVDLDVDEYEGVSFHTIAIPEPDDEDAAESLADVFGDEVELTIGFGDEHIYASLGEDGVETLSELLDNSKGDAKKPKFPMDISVYLTPILKFAATMDNASPMLEMLIKSLEKSGKDRIRVTSQVVENGSRMRIEVEEGILKLIGAAAQSGMGGRLPLGQ